MSEFLTGNTDLKITNPYHMEYLKWLHFKPSTGDIPSPHLEGVPVQTDTIHVLYPLKNTFKTWAAFKWQMTGDISPKDDGYFKPTGRSSVALPGDIQTLDEDQLKNWKTIIIRHIDI